MRLQALENVTQGVAIATSHRVISPAKGSTPRYSIPFFQMITQDLVIGKSVLDSTFLSNLYFSDHSNIYLQYRLKFSH